jgi:hypothetical protein
MSDPPPDPPESPGDRWGLRIAGILFGTVLLGPFGGLLGVFLPDALDAVTPEGGEG